MKKVTFILLVLISYLSYSQNKNLTCLDFSKGEFRNINTSNPNLNSTIVRNNQKQLEITKGVENYKIIKWLNDCEYSLFFSNKDAKKDPFKKFINKNGGIHVVMGKIKDNGINYKTSYFDGKKDIKGEGKFIKIGNNAQFK